MKISKDELIFIPLGGSGEIGMNCNLYHYKGSWIMIDLGVMFGNSSISSNELIMPNLNFILENKIKIDGLILTHAHEDHIGAVPYLYKNLGNVPIFTTSFTASFEKENFYQMVSHLPILTDYNKNISIGNFKIEIFALTHSFLNLMQLLLRLIKEIFFILVIGKLILTH